MQFKTPGRKLLFLAGVEKPECGWILMEAQF